MTYRAHQECKHFTMAIPMYEIGACDAVAQGSSSATEHVPGEKPGCVFGDAEEDSCPCFYEKGGE